MAVTEINACLIVIYFIYKMDPNNQPKLLNFMRELVWQMIKSFCDSFTEPEDEGQQLGRPKKCTNTVLQSIMIIITTAKFELQGQRIRTNNKIAKGLDAKTHTPIAYVTPLFSCAVIDMWSTTLIVFWRLTWLNRILHHCSLFIFIFSSQFWPQNCL